MDAVAVRVPTGFEHAGELRRDLWLRPWSSGDVLALGAPESAAASAAGRTSEILGRCLSLEAGGPPAGAGLARRLTVGDRQALLLHLHRLTRGDGLDLVGRCHDCGEGLEMELAAADLLVPTEPPGAAEAWVEVGGGVRVRVRSPTGDDLERAARRAVGAPEAAARELLHACVLEVAGGSTLPAEAEAELAERLAGLDPQAEIRLAAVCPHCGSALELELDPGELVRAELDRAHARLFQDVHLLALCYHWSEAEILALPDDRRRRYLALLASAPAAPGAPTVSISPGEGA